MSGRSKACGCGALHSGRVQVMILEPGRVAMDALDECLSPWLWTRRHLPVDGTRGGYGEGGGRGGPRPRPPSHLHHWL